jgi:hypothetical protein
MNQISIVNNRQNAFRACGCCFLGGSVQRKEGSTMMDGGLFPET